MSETLDNSDLQNQNIQINADNPSISNDHIENENKTPSIENIQQKIGENAVQSATESFTKSWIEKYLCCLDFLKKYFQINSDDFYKRFLYSLIPFNHKFQETTEKNPDLYGPFWIYTTLILTIASCGSLTRFFKGTKINDNKNENFFQEFIPIAASIIYIIGFGLPILLTFLMKAFGSSINFVNVICTYGYSFSVFLPAVIFCVSNVNILQWIVLSYACFSSTSLLVVNYWKELQNFDSTKKYIICGVVLVIQIGLFILIKMCFFRILSDEIQGN
jgi:hypothetical protein